MTRLLLLALAVVLMAALVWRDCGAYYVVAGLALIVPLAAACEGIMLIAERR